VNGADLTGPVVEVRGLTRRFGGVVAVSNLDLDVQRGEVLGVIGPNGAGKSTLVGLISGALAPTAGRITLNRRDITGDSPATRARLGIGRTHQTPRPFEEMTVLENLLLAADAVSRPRSAAQRHKDCTEILGDTGLARDAATRAGQLTLLQRKRLELARALALEPCLIMLDEIGAGLVEAETTELIELVRSMRDHVDATLVIEHVMEVITECCDRTVVLDLGTMIADGPTQQVLADPAVAAVYLGTSASSPSDEKPPVDPTPVSPVGHVVGRLVGTDAATTTPLLTLRDVVVDYGHLRALHGVDLEVNPGECVALLGSNGSGKTTVASAIAGTVALQSGQILFDGEELAGRRPDQISHRGVSLCIEGRRIFATLSVEENLQVAAGDVPRHVIRERLDAVYEIFPILAERRHRSGTAMSGGQQQLLAVARALMSSPKLVVFDEISLGLSPIAVDQLYQTLEVVIASGVASILVEQHIDRGLALASRAYVLSNGRVALSGAASEVRDDPALSALYVGASNTNGGSP